MSHEDALSLRERKALNTRRALSDAALELAFDKGLENVRRADIAERVGVSVRTFNNYFGGKYEAIGYRQRERVERGVALLRATPTDVALWTAVADAMVAPLEAEGVDATPGPHQLREIRKLLDLPQLHQATFPQMFGSDSELAAAVAERTGTDLARDTYPRLVAGAVGLAFRTAFELYAQADTGEPVTVLWRRAIAAIAAGLTDPSA